MVTVHVSTCPAMLGAPGGHGLCHHYQYLPGFWLYVWSIACTLSLFEHLFLFIYLAMLGLRCSTWDL